MNAKGRSPGNTQLNVSMSEDLKAMVVEAAHNEDMNAAQFVRKLLRVHFEQTSQPLQNMSNPPSSARAAPALPNA